LYLVDDGVRHECTYGVVAARNQIDSKVFALRAENDGLIHCAVVEEANKQQLTLKHDPSFRFWRVEMTVRSRVTSRLDRVEHTMQIVIQTAMIGADNTFTSGGLTLFYCFVELLATQYNEIAAWVVKSQTLSHML